MSDVHNCVVTLMDSRPRVGPVAAVLVNFNGWEHTVRCIRELTAPTDRPDDVIVVDNGSTRDEASLVAGLDIPGVISIRSQVNLGFAGGLNLGITQALLLHARYVFIVNNDTAVLPGCLVRLREEIERTGAAVACPLVVDMDNPSRVWSAGGECVPEEGIFFNRFKGEDRSAAWQPGWVTFAPASAMLCRSDVFDRVGLFPERWFLYFEDTEFSIGVNRAGLRMTYVPDAVVKHFGGAATRVGDVNYYYYWRNCLLFLLEYARGWRRVIRVVRLLITVAAITSANLLRGRLRRALLPVAGLIAAFRGEWGHSPTPIDWQ